MSNTVAFIIGIFSSILATIVIYLVRFNIGFLVNFLFFKVYPNITGEYNLYRLQVQLSKKTKSKKESDNNIFQIKPGEKVVNQEILKWIKKKKRKVHFIMKIQQFANRVNGELFSIEKDNVLKLEKINGKITPSRILILNFESKNDEHHNFGTYLIKLSNDLNITRGTATGLCFSCGDTMTFEVLLEKK